MDTKQKQKLKRFIKELEQIRGRHTELVSVYIPVDYDIVKVINHLIQEQGTAVNIKDKTTRKNVIDSLERMIRHLRLYKRTPEHGLVAFSGNISAREGQTDIQVWSIEPPEPVNMRLYRCDQTFVLDLLKTMLEVKEVYGLIVLDKREGTIGLLKGNTVEIRVNFKSDVPGKQKAGGQSQARFARLREGAAKDFFKKVGAAANKEFLGMKELKGILVGGPVPTKEMFLDGGYLNTELKNKIVGVKDLAYTGEFGLHELVDKSKDVLAKEAITEEKELVGKFLDTLAKSPEKAAYGKDEVDKALKMGAVDILLLSEDLSDEVVNYFEEKAEETDAKYHMISTETSEGVQIRDLGGICAILRFAIS